MVIRCLASRPVQGIELSGGVSPQPDAQGRRFSGDGTWDKILSTLLAHADAAGLIDWEVSIDSTVNRAHQHATNLPRDTGGPGELHETARGAA